MIEAIELCSKMIPEKVAKGQIIYGVNTEFGGSADTRSNDVERVQQSLISHLTCGIVADGKQEPALASNEHGRQSNGNNQSNGKQTNGERTRDKQTNGRQTDCNQSDGMATNGQGTKQKGPLPLHDALAATCMPESWARRRC